MSKKIIFIVLGTIGAIGLGLYHLSFLIFSSAPFYTKTELIRELSEVSGKQVKEVQDIIALDEKSMFVPFIEEGDQYSTSHWAWKRKGWEVVAIGGMASPQAWIGAKGTPTYITWNIHPEEDISYMNFYLLKNRSYSVSQEQGGKRADTYMPKFQLEQQVSFGEQSYGVIPISEKWKTVLNSFEEVKVNQSIFDSNAFFMSNHPDLHIGWRPYNKEGKETIFTQPGGSGSSYGNYIMYVNFVNEHELE